MEELFVSFRELSFITAQKKQHTLRHGENGDCDKTIITSLSFTVELHQAPMTIMSCHDMKIVPLRKCSLQGL